MKSGKNKAASAIESAITKFIQRNWLIYEESTLNEFYYTK